MVAPSKFFQNHIQTQSCQSLRLHGESCSKRLVKDFFLYAASNFKYFAPVCILPALIKLRSMNKEKLRNTLKYYVECSATGTLVGYTTTFFICFLRYLCGQFGFYTFLFVPSMIGGCMVNFASQRVIDLFETSMFQCNIETFLLMRKNILSRLISDSHVVQTYIFMICSALILQGKQLYNLKGFWLLQTNPKIPEVENEEPHNKCELHAEASCKSFLLDGMRKYFILGLTLDIVKTVMSKAGVSKNQSRILGKVANFRIRSTALLTTYIGIYRFSNCFLNRYSHRNNSLNHFTSAFFAGLCYNFYPQSTLFSYALVQAIRTLWNMILLENLETENVFLKYLFKVPFAKILFPFALANSVHLFCLKPEYVSPLTATITNGVTNNYPNVIKKEVNIIKQTFKDGVLQSTIKLK